VKKSLIAISLLTLIAQTAFAQDGGTEKEKQETVQVQNEETDDYSEIDDFSDLDDELDEGLESDFQISVDGEINANAMSGEGSGGNFNESYVSLSVVYKNKIRAVITAKLEEIFKENKIDLNDDFSLGEFIKEAYIEIREIKGAPVAVIVGKQPIAFGQNVQAMPIFSNNPLANLQEIDEVFGLTVELTEGLFGLFDQAEVSVFESKDKDLEIGKIDGVSIRLSKALTDNWLLSLSHVEQGNSHLTSGSERRTSVGLIGETSDGALVGWVEGMYFSNNPEYPNSSFGITAGAMMRVHETTDIIVEYTWIEKEVSQIGLGARVALTQSISLGGEIRYSDYVSRQDGFTVGISVTYTFGTSGRVQNQTSIFGGTDEEEPDNLD
jgi:hypothetical protein